MHINIVPDPDGTLAQQAAEDARAIFSARLSELDDSHQVWNDMTTTAVLSQLSQLAEAWNNSDGEAAANVVANWTATYLGAFGLIATEVLRTAAVQAWRERHPGTAEPTREDRAEMVAWSEAITRSTFAMLAEEGRTIV